MNFSLPAVAAARAVKTHPINGRMFAVCVHVLFLGAFLGASGVAIAASDATSRFAGVVQVGNAAAGGLSISNAWARATPAGVGVGAAYFTIVNRGSQSDTLVSITSPAAAMVELHQTSVENGLSRMRPAGEIVIEPGQTVNIAPGGLHAMLMGLKSPLIAGSSVPLILTFRRAGAMTVQMDVQPMTTMSHEPHPSH